MPEVILVMGPPASGKSTQSDVFIKKDYVYLNRDTEGGKISSLVPKLDSALRAGSNVVLDNLFPTAEVRRPFIDICKAMNVPIRCVVMGTSIEDAQINALFRMWKKHKKFFFSPEDLKDPAAKKDSNMFPVGVLFKYRKEYQPPNMLEGFSAIETVTFKRFYGAEYQNKALILDYDSTLRESTGAYDYPIDPSEVKLLPGRAKKLQEYVDSGHLLLGVSNQSGIHKGILTDAQARACFDRTNELLGHNIDYVYCPHQSNPPSCYCRKPQSGNFVLLIEKYKLLPSACIFVGDATSDKTAAQRIGIPYKDVNEFFK